MPQVVNIQHLNPHSYTRLPMHHKQWPRPESIKDWEINVFESYEGVQFYVPRDTFPRYWPTSLLFKQPDGDAHMVHRFLTLIVYGRLEGRPKQVSDDIIRALCEDNDTDVDDFDPTECGPTTFRDLIQFLRRLCYADKDKFIATARDCLMRDDARTDDEGCFSAVQIFLAGTELDDVELCALALRRRTFTKGVSTNSPQSYRTAAFLPADGYHVLHPAGMPYQIYSEIPTDYLFALTRAWEGRDPKDDVSEAFVEAFKGIDTAKHVGEVLEDFP